jgi:hypothetical protein
MGAEVSWGFYSLDPVREGVRLQLIAELAGAARNDASAAKLLKAIGAEPPRQVSKVRKVA